MFVIVILFVLLFHSGSSVRISSNCSFARNCDVVINKILSTCTSCNITLESNQQYIIKSPITTYGKRSIYIDGNNSTILLDGLTGCFEFNGISNVMIQNIRIDMIRDHYTYGIVIDSGKIHSTIKTSLVDYPLPLLNQSFLKTAEALLQYDPVKKHPSVNGLDIYQNLQCNWVNNNDKTANIVINQPRLPLNSYIIIRHKMYGPCVFEFYSSNNIILKNILIYSAPGCGIFSSKTTDIVLDAFFIRKKKNRPISAAVDAIHFSNMAGGDIKILNSFVEGQGDDGVNINSIYYKITSISVDRRIISLSHMGQSDNINGENGDKIIVLNGKDLSTLVKSIKITSINRDNTITLATPFPIFVSVNDIVFNQNLQPKSITISNTTFIGNRARGVLLPRNNVTIQSSRFINITGPAILVEPDAAYWFEGSTIERNWTLKDSIINNCNYGAAQRDAPIVIDSIVSSPTNRYGQMAITGIQHKNITLQNNTIDANLSKYAVLAAGIQYLSVQNNRVVHCSNQVYNIINCKNVIMSNNICVSP